MKIVPVTEPDYFCNDYFCNLQEINLGIFCPGKAGLNYIINPLFNVLRLHSNYFHLKLLEESMFNVFLSELVKVM